LDLYTAGYTADDESFEVSVNYTVNGQTLTATHVVIVDNDLSLDASAATSQIDPANGDLDSCDFTPTVKGGTYSVVVTHNDGSNDVELTDAEVATLFTLTEDTTTSVYTIDVDGANLSTYAVGDTFVFEVTYTVDGVSVTATYTIALI
jgi:hypothetical protein